MSKFTLNYDQMLNCPGTGIRITENDLNRLQPQVEAIIEQLNNKDGDNQDKGVVMLGWQDAPNTTTADDLAVMKNAADDLRDNSDIIFVIGIGGSYLGPRAVIEAVYGKNYNEFLQPKIYFVGNDTDPVKLEYLLNTAKDKRVGCIVISKSGTTTEPAIAFRFIKEIIKKNAGERYPKQIIAVTDKEKGALRKVADEENFTSFVIPDDIGGRFSVITPVGLLPIAAAGIDIEKYISGFQQAKELCDKVDLYQNPSAIIAALRFLAMDKGAVVEYQVTNSEAMQMNLEWIKQLEPESEGHHNHGLHVIPALFPTDLHSIGQIIQQGPRNIFEIGTRIAAGPELRIPVDQEDLDGLNYIDDNGLNLNDINMMAIDGPFMAHYNDGTPNMTITLTDREPQTLGIYHYVYEKSTAIMGYLMRHNPFVQPGVQFWKDMLFTMAGKPGYEENTKAFKKSRKEPTHQIII